MGVWRGEGKTGGRAGGRTGGGEGVRTGEARAGYLSGLQQLCICVDGGRRGLLTETGPPGPTTLAPPFPPSLPPSRSFPSPHALKPPLPWRQRWRPPSAPSRPQRRAGAGEEEEEASEPALRPPRAAAAVAGHSSRVAATATASSSWARARGTRRCWGMACLRVPRWQQQQQQQQEGSGRRRRWQRVAGVEVTAGLPRG